MSSLGTDIISALWKGPKVAMLVIVESTLAEPKERKSLLIGHKADRRQSQRILSATNMIFFRWRVYWGSVNSGPPQRLAAQESVLLPS
jgi:hypothetical protein